MKIGGFANDGCGGSTYGIGKIDDVRIYTRALSAGEVQQLYNTGAANVAHSNVGISNGLVGYWTMDGPSIDWRKNQLTDMFGNGNTGTLVNLSTSTSRVAGKIGQALKFDGSTSQVSIGDVTPLKITGTYSISAWFKMNTPIVSEEDIVTKIAGGALGYAFGIYQGRAYVQNNSTYTDVGNPVSDTNWHHMVGTYDGTNLHIYLDGVLGQTKASAAPNDSTLPACIGSVSSGPAGCAAFPTFNGTIDDVRIYNRALSPAEVRQLYNMGR